MGAIGVSGVIVRMRGCPCMKEGRSRQLCVTSNLCGSACEDNMIFPLQNSLIEDRWGVIRYFAAPDFNQTTCCSWIVEFCNGKIMIASNPLPCQLDKIHNCLLLSSFMRGCPGLRTTMSKLQLRPSMSHYVILKGNFQILTSLVAITFSYFFIWISLVYVQFFL